MTGLTKIQTPTRAKFADPKFRKRTPAFSLMELLIVVAIIGILAAVLFPVAKLALNAGKRTTCTANLRQIGVAQNLYSSENGNLFTPNRVDEPGATVFWCQQLLPYLGLPRIGWPAPPPNSPTFWCPAAKTAYPGDPKGYDSTYVQRCSYSQNIELGGSISSSAGNLPTARRSSVQKPSRMVLVADGVAVNFNGSTVDPPSSRGAYRHDQSINLLFVDGHVETSKAPASQKYNWSIGSETN